MKKLIAAMASIALITSPVAAGTRAKDAVPAKVEAAPIHSMDKLQKKEKKTDVEKLLLLLLTPAVIAAIIANSGKEEKPVSAG